MFILAIFCLTTSNLPWFMDLTFKVPIQYCYLQHWTLLSLYLQNKLLISRYFSVIKINKTVPFAEMWMDCHIEWSKSEKQISYNITYMWNLEKWYRWTYLQSRNRHTDIENKFMDPKGTREVGWPGRLGLAYIHYYV